ncbi:MAG: ferrous iron transporter B [delta proteobacterium ML8_F1]|nr:MAG: ferrous iron transporter B [delta proteobacterium ML8_F1]
MTDRHVALVGNPNSGKTTLFNRLTGANHYVGNWAGVTVEKKEGFTTYKGHRLHIIDLPGKYSLSAYSLEEKIARDYLLEEKPEVVINLVPAANLERNLYLTLQLIEMELPVILAVNMIDELEQKGLKIDFEALQEALGIRVVPISSARNQGIDTLLDEVIQFEPYPEFRQFTYSEVVEKALDQLGDEPRWQRIKMLEKDLEIPPEHPAEDYLLEETVIKERYEIINRLLEKVIFREKSYRSPSDAIDKVLLNKYLGLPIFALVMALVFYMTFSIGNIFVDILDEFFSVTLSGGVAGLFERLDVSPWLLSLVSDGIIGGVGGVLTFLPNIAILFVFISLLEDSGYMGRAAYLMDKWMQKVGLNGKFFIPMLLGFGCNVPAIMSTRTLENPKDRLVAILINPFMSCGARFPVYVLFASVFFAGYEFMVVLSLYLLGILVAVSVAYLFRKTILKGEESFLVLEIPDYRIPRMRNLVLHVWERVKDYLVKAGTVIFAASIILWFLLNYNFTGGVALVDSFGAMIGRAIAPVFSLAGFGNWQSALSLLSGIFAKEIVVSNTAIIYGLGEAASLRDLGGALAANFTPLSAYAFLVFVLLYTPCVAVIGVIKRETNSWFWMFFSLGYQLVIAFALSAAVYQLGSLFAG